ncbi:MAG TPA: GGDEF domain-containing protein, partial [Pseudonocardiaceae bacterium]|nr:GGDEF domain-containing protein [Pseudonocardiaceae bacterium]
MTVLRPDIVEPEPIEDGTGWRAFDAPTQPASPRPLSHPGAPAFEHDMGYDAPHPGPRHPEPADPDRGVDAGGLADSSKLIRLHESIGALLASRGEWQQAYQHLRSALDLVYSDRIDRPPVPEQLRREVDRLRKEHAEAREQSIRDSLTASYNRRYLDQRLTSLLADTARAGDHTGLAVALADLDWFKQVNDTFGHLVGDRVLQRVVDLLSDGLPDGGFCARYGGEEFVLVVPGIDARTAVAVAEAARARVEQHPWSQLVPGLRVTVSIGLAHEPSGGL